MLKEGKKFKIELRKCQNYGQMLKKDVRIKKKVS